MSSEEDQTIVNLHFQGHNISSNDPASVVTEALQLCLSEEQALIKAPPGLDKALAAISLSEPISYDFLKTGFKAWFAYFLATGRNLMVKEYAARLSTSTLEQVAAEVSATDAHDSVDRRLQHILHSSDRGNSRSRLLANVQSSKVSLLLPPEPCSRPTKRRRSDSLRRNQQMASPSLLKTSIADAEVTMHEGSISEALQEWKTFEIDPQYEYAWPKARNLPFVFPHYMCTAIVKAGDTACVMLSFLSDPTECHFVVDISAREVQHVAKELFGVHTQVIQMRRCLVLEHSAMVDINRSVKPRGATNVPIDKLFGQVVSTAFRQGPQRMEELSNGEMLSRCLSMTIWETDDSPGRLDIGLEAQHAVAIWRGLWPDGLHSANIMPSS
ncbi:Uu.00g077760.m01.CDS01 [Anthostomella pinea]|uniref:Uu.00g077760.m01.CDS01 n=1 Tax=Anthostomella pinea TaxID=933095 RepID=A0AAI8VKG4_9PEZI|nr:Uu.00g077760.m01.CDS01 [Anthostomella pinea]